MKRLLVGGLAAAAAGFLVVGVVTASVSNGSFETGPTVTNPPGFLPISAPSSSITGWTVSAGQIDYIGGYWAASSGSRSIDLTGSNNSAGAISQTLTTIPGSTYTVTFDMAGNPAGPPAVKTMTVSATGAASAVYTFDTTAKTLTNMGWTSKTYSFLASANSTVLTFTSNNLGFYGPAIDSVVISDNIVTDKDQCKNGGWQTLVDSEGQPFKNQGDCVSFAATGGKNLAVG